MATQQEIARILNISQQAVSACFNPGVGTVRPGKETRRRVLQVAAEIGYVPNRMARSLRSGKSRAIGGILPYCKDLYYPWLRGASGAVYKGCNLRQSSRCDLGKYSLGR